MYKTKLFFDSGADGGSRTHTVLPPRDFKSRASAIPPHSHIKKILNSLEFFADLEVPPGFEPGNKGFADLCLTAWPWYRNGNPALHSQNLQV